MSSPFVAEIRIVGFNFPPTGWAFCNGQLLPISQNTALFSLLGTFYGGDGKSTFALPDMQGNSPVHQGDAPGLSPYFLGQMGGSEFVTLLQSEMPAHTHGGGTTTASANGGDSAIPTNAAWSTPGADRGLIAYDLAPAGTTALMNPQALSIAGGSLPHNNMMPYITLNFVIAMQGVFPPRS